MNSDASLPPRHTPPTDEEFEAMLDRSLLNAWPTMPRDAREHYAKHDPERMARTGVSFDDPYVHQKRSWE